MDDIAQEKLYLQKRALLRDRLKASAKGGDLDLARLTELDMRIAKMQSKRKYPLWTKFKNFGLFSINKAEKEKRSFGLYAKLAWNVGMQAVKAVAAAAIYPPVTLPLTAAYLMKKRFEPEFHLIKNFKNYQPQCKGSWLRASALVLGTEFSRPSTGAEIEKAMGLSDKSFKPDGKDDILQRINNSKTSSQGHYTENASAKTMSEPDKKRETGKSTKLSPEAAKKLVDSIMLR